MFFLSFVCYAFVRVCLFVSFGHLLEKGWPLDSRLWCLTVSLLLSHCYPGSDVALDCIDSWSLHPYLLWIRTNIWRPEKTQTVFDINGAHALKAQLISSSSFIISMDSFFGWPIQIALPEASLPGSSGADPGFLERGFVYIKVWRFVCWFVLIFLKYPISLRPNYFIFIGY